MLWYLACFIGGVIVGAAPFLTVAYIWRFDR